MFSKKWWLIDDFFYWVKIVVPLVVVFALFIFYELAHWPIGNPVYLMGTVRSTGVVAVASVEGGNALAATVELQDGKTVMVVLSHNSNPVKPGQTVRVLEQHSIFAGPTYGIADASGLPNTVLSGRTESREPLNSHASGRPGEPSSL